MRKYLRSIARYTLSLIGARHINRIMATNWRGTFTIRHKHNRKAYRAYSKHLRKALRAYRVKQFMRRVAAPFLRLWEAIKGLFWRAMQPA